MASRTNTFRSLIPKVSKLFDQVTGTTLATSLPKLNGVGYENFARLSENAQIELLQAVKSLQNYAESAKSTNERRKRLFRMMSWRQQKICEDVGYLKKLKRIDQYIQSNQKFLNGIADHAVRSYGLSFHDFAMLKSASSTNQTSTSNYRVIESLSHYIRDWSVQGDQETKPMMDYIIANLNTVIPASERHKTCVIVPGSGLGKIAHAIATMGDGSDSFGSVHAVEYSGLMHLCNKFVYSGSTELVASSPGSYDIYPGIHTCSNYYTTDSQFRSTKLEPFKNQPSNLSIHLDDFRYFEAPDLKNWDNVVVVTAFFVDTAENLIDYFDKILALTTPNKRSNSIKNGYWINVGPLKYGTAAQAELNADEIKHVRKAMGWKDKSSVNSLTDPNAYTTDGLVGYVTDKESMWQGYYGLSMWASERKENDRK
ncbi:N2227-domain-containing protein [Suhomyces tanzawaensis NRRL Y-17324]|uniref:N2227-domain-containing protein n=1 Tax=Suhomyces tanzawaensis NRRL Y-17324 TaxID=984487 RepID=A0A1E4SD46_9ASCO|nr:N2227-domain-containing protein [Suhomyces tanzawaensis NRRL Y-17324]ODV77440.1 N2227-domain-containing protein [Suhomyces tanzawaensis NRRL Y-17324]